MLNHVAETAVVRAADGSWTWKVDALYNRKMNFMHYVREVGTTETVRALGTRVAVLCKADTRELHLAHPAHATARHTEPCMPPPARGLRSRAHYSTALSWL